MRPDLVAFAVIQAPGTSPSLRPAPLPLSPSACRPGSFRQGRGRNQLVGDVIVGRHGLPIENSQSQLDQSRAIATCFMRYRSNVGCARSLHLLESLLDTILADDGNVFLSLHFPYRLKSSEPASIGGCCNQQPAFLRMAAKA